MNSHQEELLRCFEECLESEVDPAIIICDLVSRELLPVSFKYSAVQGSRLDINGTPVWKFLIESIIKNYRFDSFLELLNENGSMRLAIRMSCQYYQTAELFDMGRNSKSTEKVQKLYMKYLIKAFDNLPNPRQYCKIKSQKYKLRFRQETDPSIKMEMADLSIASLCAEISSYIMKYDKEMRVDLLFGEVGELICQASNTHVAKISFHAHKALVYTINEAFELGEQHLQLAMKASIHVAQSVELVNLYYVRLFLMFALYGRNPTVRNRKNVLQAAEDTLITLEEEKDERVYLFWKRMVLLRMAFCLIGLNYDGGPIPGLLVNRQEKTKAKTYLAEVYKIRHGMEARRKIGYEIAQARIADLENDPELSILRLKIAIEEDKMGNYGETDMIKQYSEKLERKRKKMQTPVQQRKKGQMETSPKVISGQHDILQTRQAIVREEDAENDTVLIEYFEGYDMPVIDLHGNDTSLKKLIN